MKFGKKNNSKELKGYSYTIKDEQKTITETLEIKNKANQFIYEATVSGQNQGRTIQFILNTAVDSLFSFENDTHDFPKKIQYKKLNDTLLKVSVLGENTSGFSYIQIKQ